MMKKIAIISLTVLMLIGILSFSISSKIINSESKETLQSIKCLIQMNDYDEGGAYIAISLINAEGKYKETLRIIGDDPEWYEDLKNWWEFQKDRKHSVDGISGESILTGERKQIALKIDKSLLNKGYKIRFETGVEDFKYHEKDVEINFNSKSFDRKINGSGYIKYVVIKE